MLTADHVIARRRGGELRLTRLDEAGRARAVAIATEAIAAVEAGRGRERADVEEALDAIDVAPGEVRWREGLAKLLLDRCTWDEEAGDGACTLREDVFLRAAAARRARAPGERFDRAAVLAGVARDRGMEVEAVERGLYADLRGAQVLLSLEPIGPRTLVETWERGQAQAVLLRATRVTLDVRCASAGATRALFRRIKFLRLLHTITPIEQGHRVVIDGPFSLFEASTKYGLQLALVLPLLDGCDEWSLEADVRWGKDRTPLSFRLAGTGTSSTDPPPLPEEVEALARAVERRDAGWRVSPSTAILDLPGLGLVVPDLVFERGKERVHLEVMGFWSRDAVWRRVELVHAGLAEPVVFAVSSRLRVSEDVLDEGAASALYVYKGAMNATAVLERVEEVARRRGART
jgi:predicted nuclease of restriction endonuclease-like RecB superfamily